MPKTKKKSKKKKKRSNQWDLFMEEYFNKSPYMMWHDGICTGILLGLPEEEKKEAENLLIESVKKDGMWPTQGLIELKSKKAIPVLKQRLKANPSTIIKIRVAFALEKIEETGEYVHFLIEELLNAPFWGDRIEAAMNLRHFPSKETVNALYKAMEDSEYLVRNHASESLLAIHGFVPDISSHSEIFELICADKERNIDPSAMHVKAIELLNKKLKNKKYKAYPFN